MTAGACVDHLGRVWITLPQEDRIVRLDENGGIAASVATGSYPLGFGDMSGAEAVYTLGPIAGACCVGTVCLNLLPGDCAAAFGTFQGTGAPCVPNPCPTSGVPGAVDMAPHCRAAVNPARGTCTIQYSGLRDGARISVPDAAGRLRCELPVASAPAGRVEWDLRDGAGHPLPAGIYFLRPSAGRKASPVVVLR
jgi:hypothetical protein